MSSLPTTSELLGRARDETCLHNFGDPPITEGLDRFLDALEVEAKISDEGAKIVAADTVRILVNRLRMEDAFARNPSIAEEAIRTPLIITGLPRTGTTKLQHLLSKDPGLQALPYWRAHNIAPLPGSEGVDPDPRIALAGQWINALAGAAPEVMSAHPPIVDEPEEEAFIIRMTFLTLSSGVFDHVPKYRKWLTEQDQHPSYEYLRRQLQFLQWQEGHPERPWLLKSPVHLSCLPTIADVFPDATVVHTYRDPVVAIASGLRLAETYWQSRGSHVEMEDVGPYSNFWAEQVKAFMRDRDQCEANLRFVDVQYDDIVDNVMSVVGGIYAAWGHPLAPEAQKAMTARDGSNPQHRFGQHEYALETYGLTEDIVREQFQEYIELYGTDREGK
jgi:Sulfotransferase family